MIKDGREAFLSAEKRRQAALKRDGRLFSEAARADGPYSAPTPKNPNPRVYPFCLPIAASEENLFEEARPQVAAFRETKIPWHKGVGGGPTTHLCSSQVCCVNFLAPLADKPDALLRLVKKTHPGAVQMLPVDPKGTQYVEFEWIGDPSRDYLDEAGERSGVRTRGANCTSADAAVRYQDGDGLEHVVLIEWKYCESYRDLDSIPPGRRLLADVEGVPTKSGLTRRGRYEHRLGAVVGLPAGIAFDDLCVEPLYQLMRQQLLAHEMEVEGKEAATVSVLHLSPRANHDFARVTSPAVREWAAKEYVDEDLGVTEAWRRLLRHQDRFEHRSIEDWFAPLLADPDPVLAQWRAYIRSRYSWVVGQRKRLYVDMDGVLVDFKAGLDRVSKETRAKYADKPDEIPGVFGLMHPLPGAIEAFRALSEILDTYILSTAPWENPSAWSDKVVWVQKHLGDVAYKRLIISHHKDLNRGDFLVDDRAKWGADRFEGEWIEFGSPSFPDWAAVVEYLKARAQ